MELDKDFREFLVLLNQNEVEYLVVGGYAVAFHGYPRFTGDFDIWANGTNYNLEKLIKAIEQFGFESGQLKNIDFEHEVVAFHLGTPPVRIDIMNKRIMKKTPEGSSANIQFLVYFKIFHKIKLQNKKTKRKV